MRSIPNWLSISRIPLGGVVLILATTDFWVAACSVLIVGTLTDLLDGIIARRFDITSELGARVLEPLGDMALTVTSLIGLLASGVWPWWVGGLILSGIIALQTLSFIRVSKENRLMSALKRAQGILQPLLYLLLLFCIGATYLYVAVGGEGVGLMAVTILSAAAVSIGYYRRERLMAFLNGK